MVRVWFEFAWVRFATDSKGAGHPDSTVVGALVLTSYVTFL